MMKVKDTQVSEAIDVLRQYCEEHRECEGCKIDCSMLKRGLSPCFWVAGCLEEG